MSKLFLVLEPSNHIYNVISAAQRRGFTVAVFRAAPRGTDGAPSAASMDSDEQHLLDSWTDQDASFSKIVAACNNREVAGTYAAHESLLELDARIQEHFSLPTKTRAFIRRYLDKVNVRNELRHHGLTALRVFAPEALGAMQTWPLDGGALYFKPIHGTASAYVRRCTSLSEAHDAIAWWHREQQPCSDIIRQHLRNGRGCFFEEEATGELMSLEGYVRGGKYYALGLSSRTVLARDPTIELGATFPYPHPSYAAIVAKVDAIHQALHVPHGATHAEIIVCPDGRIELVELNLRFAGADVLRLVDTAYGTAIEDILVELAVGAPADVPVPTQPRCYASVHYLLPPAGATAFESIELSQTDVLFQKLIKPLGSALGETVAQADMIAGFVTHGDTYESAVRRACSIRRTVRINGRLIEHDPNNVVIAR